MSSKPTTKEPPEKQNPSASAKPAKGDTDSQISDSASSSQSAKSPKYVLVRDACQEVPSRVFELFFDSTLQSGPDPSGERGVYNALRLRESLAEASK
jgi:hypothetical protein